MRPSYFYHQIAAITGLIGTLLSLLWIYKNCGKSNSQLKIILLFLLISISWGIHTLIHFWGEVYFAFNPLDGKSTAIKDPVPINVKVVK